MEDDFGSYKWIILAHFMLVSKQTLNNDLHTPFFNRYLVKKEIMVIYLLPFCF